MSLDRQCRWTENPFSVRPPGAEKGFSAQHLLCGTGWKPVPHVWPPCASALAAASGRTVFRRGNGAERGFSAQHRQPTAAADAARERKGYSWERAKDSSERAGPSVERLIDSLEPRRHSWEWTSDSLE